MFQLKNTSIQFLKGVGPARKKLFLNLGVESVEDLLYLFPRRYEDRTNLTPLLKVVPGEFQTVTGRVLARGGRRSWYTHKHVYETVIDDGTGRLAAVWFNQPYLDNYFKVDCQVVLYGKVDRYKDRLQMVSPEYEILEGEEDLKLNMGRIVPIYPLTKGVSQRFLRKVLRVCLDKYLGDVDDILPVHLRNKHRLFNIHRALANLHFPESQEFEDAAFRRICFEEFFIFQLAVTKRRANIVAKNGVAHIIDMTLVNQFKQSFPFALTGAQQRVIGEIAGDMQKSSPMLRLLQGDVGSGKTLVALFGCVAASQNGCQSAIMAPTEILARQHFENIEKMVSASELENPSAAQRIKLRTALLIGSMVKKEREATLEEIRLGKVDLVVGTHALLSEEVGFKNLSFVVIDEQHKFGVRQRAMISAKGQNPDVLVMTATPIPRTLSLTLFGDLDVSTLDEMPPGRGKIDTRLFKEEEAGEVYKTVRERVEAGEQAYIVYPLVAESDVLDLKAAKAMYSHFQKNEFKGLKIGLVHGQMKREESQEVMARFKKNEIQILIATTVLEVGVDVPNASVMVIEHAELFGLSQLHQLRGRIGRGKKNSLCLLICDATTEDGLARLSAITKSTDGFYIAEQDLLIRGPGQYFGRHQHGLNELKHANPILQIDILELARKEASELMHQDPNFAEPLNAKLKKVVFDRFPNYMANAEAG